MGFMKDLFRVRNVLTTLKAAVIGVIFAAIWVVWNALSLWLAQGGTVLKTIATVLVVGFVFVALFLWGYLANKFWGWK